MIAMMKTKMKYTVIASASRANLPAALNIERHIDAAFSLAAMGYTRTTAVQGFYRESIADAASVKISHAIPVAGLKEISHLATLYCGAFAQDCILVVNNESLDVWLVNLEGEMFSKLGKWTSHNVKDPSWDAYTYDGALYYTAE